MNHSFRLLWCVVAFALTVLAPGYSVMGASAVKTIREVGPEGRGNAAASAAWKELIKGDGRSIVDILEAMDGANPIALNWLRSAIDTIAARELAAGRKLPTPALEKFLARKDRDPRARRLAYELIARVDPATAEKLIAGMLDDPSAELRRDAVARIVAEAEKHRAFGRTADAKTQYAVALKSARDVDQVEGVAKAMKELGEPIKLAEVFGWLTTWKVVGPFDNTQGAGFEKVYLPEEKVDLQAEYEGRNGKVRWKSTTTTNEFGLVDLNNPLGALKGVAGYAYTEVVASTARPVELRLGCKNGWKIWFNGKYIFGRDEYHRGIEIDQYRFKVDLKPGKNSILVKVLQNEQVEDWTKEWEFQLRITDALGAPIDLAQR